MPRDNHRTTVTMPMDVWAEVQAELEHEQDERIVPRWMKPGQYAALLMERQILAQQRGRPRTPAKKLRTGRRPWPRSPRKET